MHTLLFQVFHSNIISKLPEIVYYVDYEKLIVGKCRITSITVDAESFEIVMHLAPLDYNIRSDEISIPYKNVNKCVFNTEAEAIEACKREATKKIDKLALHLADDLVEYMRSYLAITKQDPKDLELTKALRTVVEFAVNKRKEMTKCES